MNTRFPTSDAGYSLLSVLVTGVLLGFFVLTTFILSYQLQSASAGEIHSALARSRALAAALRSLLQSPAQPPLSRLSCIKTSARAGRHEISRQLCALIDLSGPEVSFWPRIEGAAFDDPEHYPQIAFNQIFQAPSTCSLEQALPGPDSALGFPLSPAAMISAYLCRSLPGGNGDRRIISANLALENDFEGSGVLAALGYMDINADLRASADLLLLSGGDMHIKRILNSAPQPPLITLVSATGVVSLEEPDPALRLKIISWGGIYAPETPAGTGISPLLPLLERSVVGFASPDL